MGNACFNCANCQERNPANEEMDLSVHYHPLYGLSFQPETAAYDVQKSSAETQFSPKQKRALLNESPDLSNKSNKDTYDQYLGREEREVLKIQAAWRGHAARSQYFNVIS